MATTSARVSRDAHVPALEPSPEEFAAAVAHDLESSILVIAEHLAMLRLDEAGLTPDQTDRVERISRTVARMRGLVSRVREYAHAGAQLELEEVDLQAVLEEVVETLEPLIAEREAAVVSSKPLPTVIGDRIRLSQVLLNLVTNALKFGPRRGGRVTLAASRSGAWWRIVVSDQGPGIPSAERDAIFEPFRRLAVTRREPGSGLGLAICQRVAQAHGGSVFVDAAPAAGASFVFMLPVRERQQARSPGGDGSPAPSLLRR